MCLLSDIEHPEDWSLRYPSFQRQYYWQCNIDQNHVAFSEWSSPERAVSMRLPYFKKKKRPCVRTGVMKTHWLLMRSLTLLRNNGNWNIFNRSCCGRRFQAMIDTLKGVTNSTFYHIKSFRCFIELLMSCTPPNTEINTHQRDISCNLRGYDNMSPTLAHQSLSLAFGYWRIYSNGYLWPRP